jgi:hypothetical protein
MSDFASLLSQFAVKAKATDSTSNSNINSKSNTNKRPAATAVSILDKGQHEQKRTKLQVKTNVYIPDRHDLSIEISFLGIGAQKAGTSWLHTMLSRHPHICLPSDGNNVPKKEVHFWDWKSNRRKGLKWYSQQFQSTTSDDTTNHHTDNHNHNVIRIMGELTPCYAVLGPQEIAEVKELFPKVKLLFLARDLVERAYVSNYQVRYLLYAATVATYGS